MGHSVFCDSQCTSCQISSRALRTTSQTMKPAEINETMQETNSNAQENDSRLSFGTLAPPDCISQKSRHCNRYALSPNTATVVITNTPAQHSCCFTITPPHSHWHSTIFFSHFPTWYLVGPSVRLSVRSWQSIKTAEIQSTWLCRLPYIQGGPKMAQFMLNPLTLSNINRFSNFFHCQNQEKICNNIITKDPPHLKCVATLLVKCQCLINNNWKQDDFTNNTF